MRPAVATTARRSRRRWRGGRGGGGTMLAVTAARSPWRREQMAGGASGWLVGRRQQRLKAAVTGVGTAARGGVEARHGQRLRRPTRRWQRGGGVGRGTRLGQ
ncbi:Os12g0178901 [Oryza sativa Japonica Group]|uniref:Os12g0178901 protein n=1 Tax=Oryza sativa subsp. japonica TaxID=39947 RepID=A0A0P0Y7L9_ORYSJ|nr:Os12g0178901 [Oryza sativa Japonica Group]